MHDNRWSWEGIQLMWVILGLVGAALGIASLPPMSKKQLWAALVSGMICAGLAPGLLAEILTWYRNAPVILPGPVANTLAFFFGIGGMFIVPGSIVFWATAKTNPMYVVDWIRGKVPAPPPSNPFEHTDDKEPKP